MSRRRKSNVVVTSPSPSICIDASIVGYLLPAVRELSKALSDYLDTIVQVERELDVAQWEKLGNSPKSGMCLVCGFRNRVTGLDLEGEPWEGRLCKVCEVWNTQIVVSFQSVGISLLTLKTEMAKNGISPETLLKGERRAVGAVEFLRNKTIAESLVGRWEQDNLGRVAIDSLQDMEKLHASITGMLPRLEEIADQVNEQELPAVTPISLDEIDVAILTVLATVNLRLSHQQIEGHTRRLQRSVPGVTYVCRRTIGDRIPFLIQTGLAVQPKGKKSGVTITPLGRSHLERIKLAS